MCDDKQNPFLLSAFRACVLGLMPPKRDGASESTLSLPAGEELKTAAERDGSTLYNSVLAVTFHDGTLR